MRRPATSRPTAATRPIQSINRANARSLEDSPVSLSRSHTSTSCLVHVNESNVVWSRWTRRCRSLSASGRVGSGGWSTDTLFTTGKRLESNARMPSKCTCLTLALLAFRLPYARLTLAGQGKWTRCNHSILI